MKLKLNQIIALVAGKKTRIQRSTTEIHHGWGKDRLSGISRTFAPIEDGGETFPSEERHVQLHVGDAIERLTAETIQTEFARELGAGTLEWRTINIDGEGNFHYVKDYNLFTKSVIISEVVKGEEVRWKNLEKVWELLRSEGKFKKYVKDGVASFMAGP